ncbi:MAG: hypothetical protein ACREAX_03540 [Candidatus Nitrosotenuis sp.]
MRLSKPIIALGIILIVLGTIFLSQGRGQLGPESSFMYHNNDWIYYGMGMIIAGIVVSGSGVFLLRL